MESLKPARIIRNWVAPKGFVGRGDFGASADEKALYVGLERGSSRRISSGKVRKAYALWEGYLEGRVPRAEFDRLLGAHHAKYVLSVFRHFMVWSSERPLESSPPPKGFDAGSTPTLQGASEPAAGNAVGSPIAAPFWGTSPTRPPYTPRRSRRPVVPRRRAARPRTGQPLP